SVARRREAGSQVSPPASWGGKHRHGAGREGEEPEGVGHGRSLRPRDEEEDPRVRDRPVTVAHSGKNERLTPTIHRHRPEPGSVRAPDEIDEPAVGRRECTQRLAGPNTDRHPASGGRYRTN